MAHQDDIALMAHLMRRAGFGASRDELEARVAKGYDATVEELLHPETQPPVDPYTLLRYQPSALLPGGVPPMGNVNYMYYLVTTQRPLEEKMALFWHHVFATGNSKVDNYDQLLEQIDLFREQGMGNYRDLLMTVAKNPTMIFWLDNNQNHGTAVNENWGRELLELFSLGAGNYTEVDVREASRAFTGWTFGTKIPRLPYGRFPWKFEYRPEDHDDGEKTFLGHKGNFNGEDIIDIIVQQPACAKFICRHLYNFFVADEPQVPAWNLEPPRDPAAIDMLAQAFQRQQVRDEAGAARAVQLRLLQECPLSAPEVAGRGRGRHAAPDGRLRDAEAGLRRAVDAALLHGPGSAQSAVGGGLAYRQGMDQQRLADVAHQLRRRAGRQHAPARRAGHREPAAGMGVLEPEQMVDNCLDLLGPVEVGADTKKVLTEQAKQWGQIRWDTPAHRRRHQADRRAAAADRGDARISVRLKDRHERLGGILHVGNAARRIPCWSSCNSAAATTT